MTDSDISQEDLPFFDGMPQLGLGTWQNRNPAQCAESVKNALDLGYRHIDTAQAYGNEAAVGRGISKSEVPREEIFLATKIETGNLAYEDVLETAERSMDRLDVDYIDLLYVHWPAHRYDPEETLPAFDDLREQGKINHIGVSNFTSRYMEEAEEGLDSEIFANQIEMHPLLQQEEMRSYCENNDFYIVAYSPLARGDVFNIPELSEIADKYDVSEAQVSLAWLMEKGVVAIPKATSEAHISDNWQSLELKLDCKDIEKIDSIEREDRKVDPPFAPDSW